MHVVLLHNLSSGRGRAKCVVQDVLRTLAAHGCRVESVAVGPGADPSVIERAAVGAACIAVAGGDGTVHHTLPVAVRTGVPIYQLAMGTENLFAREFGMDASPDRLARALQLGRVVPVDVAICNARPFVLMCSVGFDANIVERVSAARRGPITKADYLKQALLEVAAPRIPTLTVHADGEPLIRARPGLVVIANSRQYAVRLDPARNADMTDGLLDIVFFPGGSRAELARLGARAMFGAHTRTPGLVTRRARSVTVRSESSTPFQLDGEHAGHIVPEPSENGWLSISVQPGALKVLMPAD